jgi:hypothetical protein
LKRCLPPSDGHMIVLTLRGDYFDIPAVSPPMMRR